MNLLSRLILIPIGYLAAIFAAVGLIAAVQWGQAYGPVADDPALLGMTTMVIVTDTIVLLGLIGTAALLPSLAAIALAEAFSLRGFLYFCAAGLVVAAIVTRVLDPSVYAALPTDPATIAASGLAGGLFYWLTSGRWSGRSSRAEPKGT